MTNSAPPPPVLREYIAHYYRDHPPDYATMSPKERPKAVERTQALMCQALLLNRRLAGRQVVIIGMMPEYDYPNRSGGTTYGPAVVARWTLKEVTKDHYVLLINNEESSFSRDQFEIKEADIE